MEGQSKQWMEQPHAKQSLSSRDEDNNALQKYLKGNLGTTSSFSKLWDRNRLSCLPLIGMMRAVIKWTSCGIHTLLTAATTSPPKKALSQPIKGDSMHISSFKQPWLLTATTPWPVPLPLWGTEVLCEQIYNSSKCFQQWICRTIESSWLLTEFQSQHMRFLETAFSINQLPKWHPICASGCQKNCPCPPSYFSATYSCHFSCQSQQPSGCIGESEQGAALAEEWWLRRNLLLGR